MLETMKEFFENRIDHYDEHMLTAIEGAKEFYPYTSHRLPRIKEAKILDLGCGTGLELKEYLTMFPDAKITGIDLSQDMLNVLKSKFPKADLMRVTVFVHSSILYTPANIRPVSER